MDMDMDISHYFISKLFKDSEFLQVLKIVHISQKVEFSVKMSVIVVVLTSRDIELKISLLKVSSESIS